MRPPILSSSELTKLDALARRALEALLLENLHRGTILETPILLVGATYPGTWLEHNQDTVFLAQYAPENAWATNEAFMLRQREDGLLPFCLPRNPQDAFFKSDAVFWQVQSVYPFVRSAMMTAAAARRPIGDFRRIYKAGCNYDRWFRKNRDRAGSGLVEMYCEYDTGHDNSPRVTDGGLPHSCPGNDASNMPDLPCMPLIAADLSATRYGDRIALAELAEKLGLPEESHQWRRDAEALRQKMQELLYDAESDYYYDRSPEGLRPYRTEHITRLFLNHVLEPSDFNRIYDRYFRSPSEFDGPFPYPAVSLADPSFVKDCPRNCWGSNCQANTAERALLWLRDYHLEAERRALLAGWARIFVETDGDFGQEVHPFTRKMLPSGGLYSPSLILCIEAAREFTGFEPAETARVLRARK